MVSLAQWMEKTFSNPFLSADSRLGTVYMSFIFFFLLIWEGLVGRGELSARRWWDGWTFLFFSFYFYFYFFLIFYFCVFYSYSFFHVGRCAESCRLCGGGTVEFSFSISCFLFSFFFLFCRLGGGGTVELSCSFLLVWFLFLFNF